MKWIFLALLLLCPVSLFAQTYPALYAVTGVEPDDDVDIRAAPEATAPSLAKLEADARDIEVIALDETKQWGWINIGESSGWVAMKFMNRQFTAGNSLLPRPLICFGTEPFWNLDIDTGPIAVLGLLDEPPRRFFGLWATASANRTDRYAMMAESRDNQMNAVVKRSICSDGMSDRIYGLEIDLLVRGSEETQFYSGCCTITPEAD